MSRMAPLFTPPPKTRPLGWCALLSRARVYVLKALDETARRLLERALTDNERAGQHQLTLPMKPGYLINAADSVPDAC